MPIQSFGCSETEELHRRDHSRRFVNIASVAVCKRDTVNAASLLNDVRAPAGNQLEALKGKRQGRHSIRINEQWRICFAWTRPWPADVEITDRR
jgi:toxin HigB-1